MIRLLIPLLLLSAGSASAQLYVPDASLRADIENCQTLWPDLQASDNCLATLAQTKRSSLVCNYIHDNYLHWQCHQSFRGEGFAPAGFLHAAPLVLFFLALLALLVLKPPRGSYITGMFIGAVVAIILLYVRSVPFEWMQSIQPYVPMLAWPVDGLMRFAPTSFSEWPFSVRFVTVHIIAYGGILGSLLQGERRDTGAVLLLFALLLTFWDHPILVAIRAWFQALGS